MVMGMEVLGADAATVQVKLVDGEEINFAEKEAKATAKDREEAAVFGMESGTDGANGAGKEADHAARKDAAEEWPAQHTLYFVKFRSYDDPKLNAKLEQAEKDIQKITEARSQILEALRAKKSERNAIISKIQPLNAENALKKKEMEPLQDKLGRLRSDNSAMKAKSMGLCSSEEELNNLIKSLNYRISHESISLDEEKRLLREIKQLEGTRSKVVAIAAERAKLQDSMVQGQAIQDHVNQIGSGLDEVRRDRQEIRSKIKVLEDELAIVRADIDALEVDLSSATTKKDKAYDASKELKNSRALANACFYQNRQHLNHVKDLAAKGEAQTLQELCHVEVEKFMAQWCSSKKFREDYEKRILSSLNNRQLCRDGRMRNPDEKPIMLEPEVAPEPEAAPAKQPAKPAKQAVSDTSQANNAPTEEAQGKATGKTAEGSKAKAAHSDDVVNSDDVGGLPKESPKLKEIDPEKLKEMKREEEIAKNKLALERKKKLAEKQAAKAAARAEKESEKKLKEKEKRAKKKAASSSAEPEEQTEADAKSEEPVEEVKEEEEAPVKVAKEQKGSIRQRSVSKTQKQLPKVILKKKKSQAYWSWAAPAAAAVAGVLVLALGVFAYYKYYLPVSN